jgi:uncharacterized membrane protein YjgN (DUF898 family)
MSTTETAPLPATSQDFHRLSFTGNAAEYFGIWIVNILLTIITLASIGLGAAQPLFLR